MESNDIMDPTITPLDPQGMALSDPRAGDSQRLWFRGLLLTCLVTGAAAVVGLAGPSVGYLILEPLTPHAGVLLMASLGSLIVAVIVAPPLPLWGNVLRVLAVLGLSLVLAVVALFVALSFVDGSTRTVSPDGRSVAVVTLGSDMIDPLWYVTIQQTSPLVARTWDIGCFNGDSPEYGLASVRWLSSTLFEAKAESGRTFQVIIDPRNSQPSATISSGC